MSDFTSKTSRKQPLNLSDLIVRQAAEDGQLLIGCTSANPRAVLDLVTDLQAGELLDLDAREIWEELQSRKDAILNSSDDGRDVFFDIALRDGRAGRILSWVSRSIIPDLPYFDLVPRLISDIRKLRLTLDTISQLSGGWYAS